jgi:N-acetylglucosaminyldiphosphoundecaprenol N-acetyl-beta-D-mannosaminyltransferase
MKRTAMSLPRANILGVGIGAINMAEALTQITNWIDTDQRHYVSVCTVHTVMECQRDPAMRRAVNGAGLATPDGMPLVWLGRRLSGRPTGRVYGPDLMLALCQVSIETGYRHYFYGGEERIPQQLAQRLTARFPGLTVVGAYSPPFRPLTEGERARVVEQVNEARPDIIWVGLGTPMQDLWMAAYRPLLNAPVLIGVGAAFDIHSGRQSQAPKWMRRNGLEWLFRLVQEPRRLWRRYLLYNPWFVSLVALQRLGWRKYSLPPVSEAEIESF